MNVIVEMERPSEVGNVHKDRKYLGEFMGIYNNWKFIVIQSIN